MTFAVIPADSLPEDVPVVGVPVFKGRTVPAAAGIDVDLAYLARRGFEGRVAETMVVPSAEGTAVIAVGVGPAEEVDGYVVSDHANPAPAIRITSKASSAT